MYEDMVITLCSDYAAIAHQGQFRKDRITPYISHPGRVAGFVYYLGNLNFLSVCAAWLHDVMEDCAKGQVGDDDYPFIIKNHETRDKDIRLFLLDNPNINKADGQIILELVRILTMSQDKSIPKRERKEKYIESISQEGVESSILKYCDRLDNLTTVHYFSQGGFKWYIVDTQMIIDKLSEKVKAVNSNIHIQLERKLEAIKETYKKIYE